MIRPPGPSPSEASPFFGGRSLTSRADASSAAVRSAGPTGAMYGAAAGPLSVTISPSRTKRRAGPRARACCASVTTSCMSRPLTSRSGRWAGPDAAAGLLTGTGGGTGRAGGAGVTSGTSSDTHTGGSPRACACGARCVPCPKSGPASGRAAPTAHAPATVRRTSASGLPTATPAATSSPCAHAASASAWNVAACPPSPTAAARIASWRPPSPAPAMRVQAPRTAASHQLRRRVELSTGA